MYFNRTQSRLHEGLSHVGSAYRTIFSEFCGLPNAIRGGSAAQEHQKPSRQTLGQGSRRTPVFASFLGLPVKIKNRLRRRSEQGAGPCASLPPIPQMPPAMVCQELVSAVAPNRGLPLRPYRPTPLAAPLDLPGPVVLQCLASRDRASSRDRPCTEKRG